MSIDSAISDSTSDPTSSTGPVEEHRVNFVRLSAAALIVAVLSVCAGGCTKGGGLGGGSDEPRVMVLGIDGATWDVLTPMMEAGELPNLARLYESGVHGVLRSRPPALSPVVWSTVFTGKLPEAHGVVDWKTSQSKHRRVKALWEITSERNIATHVFNVPSTYPPIPIAGAMIAGFPLGGATLGGNTGAVTSRAGLDDKAVGAYYQFNAKLIRAEIAKLDVGEWTDWFEPRLRNRPTWRAAMRAKRLANDKYYLSPIYRTDGQFIFTSPPDLLARLGPILDGRPYIPEGPGWSKHAEPDTPDYLFEHLAQVAETQTDTAAAFVPDDWRLFVFIHTLVDRTSHPYWAYSQAEKYVGLPPEKAARYGAVVAESYREMDRQLGVVLSRIPDDTYVVLASDHGFQANADKRQFIGAHHLDGIYLVAGPGLTGMKGGQTNIEDITPTVLYLLGLPVADDMAGKVVPEVRQALNRRTTTVPTYEGNMPARGTSEPVDQQTWEQLKGLGYVE